jgi:hypothetical protein
MRAGQSLVLVAVAALAFGAPRPAPAAEPAIVLALPMDCVPGQTCAIQNYLDRDPGPAARDFRCEGVTYDGHTGVDFRVPDMAAQRAGVLVLAAADGRVLRTRDAAPDISVRVAGEASVKGVECGNGLAIEHAGGYQTQYCHLARGSLLVKPGQTVRVGQPLGRVGLSGLTEYPHLHFSVRRGDDVIDPFAPEPAAPGAPCGGGAALWRPDVAAMLKPQSGAVLNVGFAAAPVTMDAVEDGRIVAPTARAAALIAYVRAIALKAGDVQRLTVTGPDGRVLADTTADPLARDQAQRLLFAGRRAPAGGLWPPGRYAARYSVSRPGAGVVIEHRFALTIPASTR